MEQFENFVKSIPLEVTYGILFFMLIAFLIFFFYTLYRSIQNWKKSKEYIKTDVRIGDEVQVSLSLPPIVKILNINDDNTFTVTLKVHAGQISIPNNFIREIDLNLYRNPGAKVFAGKDYGINVREASKIDNLVKLYQKVQIKIPFDVYSINPSFLEEFIKNVVSEFGEKGFYKKIEFINPGTYKITNDLNESINRILRK